MKKKKFYSIMRKIPKAEIHLHAEGCISRANVLKLLSKVDTQYKTEQDIEKLFSYDNLSDFIKAFLKVQGGFTRPSDFQILFADVVAYLRRNRIVYSELHFAPSMFTRNGLEFNEILDAFLKNSKKVKRKYGITVKLIIDVSRTFGVKNAMLNLEDTLNYSSSHVVGIGLGGDESKGPARDFKEVFDKAHRFGLHCVAHAGEVVGPQSIWDAIKILGVERIGHGISAIEDKSLIKYMKSEGIPFEVCPTSNVFTKKYVSKIEDHMIKEFYKDGAVVTVNTDDPSFFKVEFIDELWNLYSKLDFSMKDIRHIIINGIEVSFMSKKKRKAMIRRVKSAWKKHVK